MARVRFDPSKNTQRTIPRNSFNKWWGPDEVPFKQLLLKSRNLNSLSTEELDELMAYQEECRVAKVGQGQRATAAQRDADSLRKVEQLLAENPDMDSESIGKLFRLQYLLRSRLKANSQP